MELANLTIASAQEGLKNGDFTADELARAYSDAAEEKNDELNAYLEVFEDVHAQAKNADADIKAGDHDALTGIPIAVKDNILIAGRRTGAASKILEGYTATYDATVIEKLKLHTPVFIGRTNCDEFGMGSSTENSAYGVTKNPHDTTRVAGGSSGGSAAAVAGGLALAALGSDTGGSIRQPASFCGVVGLKPTYGAVSRAGLIALGSSLDCIGPITKTVRDAEILFNIIAGLDVMDSTTQKNIDDAKKVKTIGVPWHLIEQEGIDEEVVANFKKSIEKLKALGYTIKDITLPSVEKSLAVYYIIMPAEASTNLARYDGVKFGLHGEGEDLLGDYIATRTKGFGEEPRRRILIGTHVLSSGHYDAFYGKALAARRAITQEFADAFGDVDVIATPTTPTPAFKIGEKSNDPLAMYLSDVFTVPANITGNPALSIPSGDEGGLPIGLHLIAPHHAEGRLFATGKAFLGE